jgi:hypothetical protein
VKLSMQKLDNQNKLLIQTNQGASNLQSQLASSLQQLASTQYMSQEAKNYWAYQLLQGYQSGLSVLSNIGRVPDVSKLLYFGPAPAAPSAGYMFAPPAPAPQPAPSGGGGGGSVVCTALHSMGLMSHLAYRKANRVGQWVQRQDPDVYKGYRYLADKVVPRMRSESLFGRILTRSMLWWFPKVIDSVDKHSRGKTSLSCWTLMSATRLVWKFAGAKRNVCIMIPPTTGGERDIKYPTSFRSRYLR